MKKLPLPDCEQLVVVTAPTESSITGTLQRFDKNDRGEWQPAGESFLIVLGRTGLAPGMGLPDSLRLSGKPKREGDGKSPAGFYRFGTAFGYDNAPPGLKLSYTRATETLECVDDPESHLYNRLVDNTQHAKTWKSSEMMRRKDEQYRLGIVVEHNSSGKSMGGSCIFFHIWVAPDHATAGCTAMTPENLLSLMNWLDPARKPLLIQLTGADYQAARAIYELPEI